MLGLFGDVKVEQDGGGPREVGQDNVLPLDITVNDLVLVEIGHSAYDWRGEVREANDEEK